MPARLVLRGSAGAAMNILVTGGAGYIGSHAVRHLLRAGHRVVVVDDLRHGHLTLLHSACAEAPQRAVWIEAGVEDHATISAALADHGIDAVMHFAACIEVAESVADPLRYYANNVGGSINLLRACIEVGVRRFVFSSTAAVYGEPAEVPIREDAPRAPINPYGRSKMMVEMAIEDACRAYGLGYAILRYFNVAGASADSVLGEMHEPETHLIPRVLSAASSGSPVSIFGDDYATPDGTCLRDYIHVQDLVAAHALALDAIEPGVGAIYNLGSATGFSVREVIDACERACGRAIERVIHPRRAGDPACLVAESGAIRVALGWTPRYAELSAIVAHAWAWECKRARASATAGLY